MASLMAFELTLPSLVGCWKFNNSRQSWASIMENLFTFSAAWNDGYDEDSNLVSTSTKQKKMKRDMLQDW